MKQTFLFIVVFGILAIGRADVFETPITTSDIDSAAFAEWLEGTEQRILPGDEKDGSRSPAWVMWRKDGGPGNKGFSYANSKTPGRRYLRIGFARNIPIGAILVRGGGSLSVLRPEAPYPGNLGDDSQWIPAQRIKNGKVTSDEVNPDEYALWLLPETIQTRALRFGHVAGPADKEYAGWLGAVYVLPARLANLAAQATVVASANEKCIKRLVDEASERPWSSWENIALKDGDRSRPVSQEDPETITLVWPEPVKLRGLAALWAGFGVGDAQMYIGPADVHPREAPAAAWKTIASFRGLKNRYPAAAMLGIDWLDFGQEISTRAVRLRITEPMEEGGHPHIKGHPKGGKRVWLGELLALQALDKAALSSALLPDPQFKEKPPIAVKFSLPEAGWVTLVIEDSTGKRVRNLIADTYFEKGENTAWWDGSDDLGRDYTAPTHGVYLIPTRLVAPGNYQVRGLWRKAVDLKFEMGLYSAGRTPWETGDKTGGWLSNHTPPNAVLFVPDAGNGKPSILIGSYVSEGTAGLAWVDLEGQKWKGQIWVGGAWTGAPYLARDSGPQALPEIYAYTAVAWSVETNTRTATSPDGEIRVSALRPSGDKLIAKHRFTPPKAVGNSAAGDANWKSQIGGLAAYNGRIVVSLPELNQLLVIDAKEGKVLGQVPLDAPRGLTFDSAGRLYALSGTKLVCYQSVADLAKLPPPAMAPAVFEDPAGITLDAKGNIYVSDRGNSHQVKVLNPQGRQIGVFGKPGAPKAGPYDPLHMNNPRGLTLDSQGRLWVAEEDYLPKRVSVWNANGTLARAFYGPADYGGGGSLDPKDKTRYYYRGMEFKLDWQNGADQVASVFYRRTPGELPLGYRSGAPQTVFYVEGRRYFTNCFNSNPTNGHGTAFLFADRNGIAKPVAAAGNANEWEPLKAPELKSLWPPGADQNAAGGPNSPRSGPNTAFFVWSDLNSDSAVQPNEVAMQKAKTGGITLMPDLTFVVSRYDDRAVRLRPKRINSDGVPAYELASLDIIYQGVNNPPSTGGDQVLASPDGWDIFTTAPKPFSSHGIAGVKNGVALWSYPSLWPGLHASHEAPVPHQPGILIGHTRVLGSCFQPKGSEPMWMLNGNHGPIYVFTADGLFVTQLLHDMRVGKHWSMPVAARGMSVAELSPSDENFWPSVTQTEAGEIYLVAGRPNSLLRVDGLDTVRRIPPFSLAVSKEDLGKARDYFIRVEEIRLANQGSGILAAEIRDTAPTVDGKMDDWSGAAWVDIDKRGTAAYFNSSSKPYDVTGAVAVAGDRLYAAWRTGDPDLLKNTGSEGNVLFKTGGALDLMIGANPNADPKRQKPVEGDQRLLITQVNGKLRALLYRAVVPGTKDPVPFTSPVWTITIDRVDDVAGQVQLAAAEGNYEISVPLALLGLNPKPAQTIRADIGLLRGQGGATTQRVYWNNKATAIVSDVPSEAQLQPNLWGRWEFKAPGKQ